ncbi:MAG: SAM-dependent methyltransferase [Chloroflexota bacterium]|nr:SAM-dependent methyltransferase [Chloroflexota bacterium]MDE2920705.1 SAM-dependent methyltransferase [Chloroflexota bacterium]
MTAANALAQRLRTRANAHGPLPFNDFMEQALYDPSDGFYSRDDAPYTDYFTSVSVHPALFGQLLAEHLDDVWRTLGQPDPFRVVELGAADGGLARQIRAAANEFPWRNSLDFVGVEHAPAPRTVDALDALYASISEVPSSSTTVIVSNEFFDALPVRLARRNLAGWVEECVAWDADTAVFADRPAPEEILTYAHRYALATPAGGRIEVRQGVDTIYRHAARLASQVVMTSIDYGGGSADVHSARLANGTLLAYRRHRASEDVLSNPGHADLTAHVNFTQLIDAGRSQGFDSFRMGQQADFLAALGVGDHLVRFQERSDATLETYRAEREAVFQLVSPTDLGRFQVLTQGKGVDLDLIRGLNAHTA